jgi:hypothetical protein
VRRKPPDCRLLFQHPQIELEGVVAGRRQIALLVHRLARLGQQLVDVHRCDVRPAAAVSARVEADDRRGRMTTRVGQHHLLMRLDDQKPGTDYGKHGDDGNDGNDQGLAAPRARRRVSSKFRVSMVSH